MRLNGHVVIVSGGTRGMGEAITRGIVSQGGKVVFGGRDEDAGKAIANELGKSALFVPLNVMFASDWERIADRAIEEFGAVTGLVNNAGFARSTPLVFLTSDEFNEHIAINQSGVFFGMQSVLQFMLQAGRGSIVNVSSPAGLKGHPALLAYSGAKAAVIGMTRSAAIELGPSGIRVNAVVPGFFATRLLDEGSAGTGRERGAKLAALRRTADPQEIVGPVTFLLSDEASYVTGAILAVDGGLTA